MEVKMVTIKDIAKAANVDPSTVSRTLSDSPRVKPETKARILELCDQMGYTPNAIARALVKRGTRIIGMLVPDLSNSFYSELMVLAGNAARSLGFDIMWYNSFQDEELEKKYFRLLIAHQVDAIIIHPINGSKLDYFKKFTNRIPTVFIGDIPETEGICCVSTDNYNAGRLAATELIDRGCQRLAFIGVRNDRLAHTNRLKGFLDECNSRDGIRTSVPRSPVDMGTFDRAYVVTCDLLSMDFNPDGIAAVSDHAAMGVMKACSERGLRIPDDIRLIGFDDVNYSRLPNISLTSIAPGRESLIEQAMELVLQMLEKGICQERREVSPNLMIRSTTGV